MRLELALASDGPFEQGKGLDRLGEKDLDQVVDALNRYVERAARLQREASVLSTQLAQAERFSALGKMAAQIAHEIRNPMGAMRLKAENALAGDNARRERALKTIIEQIGRIESQVTSLLALTQPVTVCACEVDLKAWLTDIIQTYESAAESRQIALGVDIPPYTTQPVIDPAQLARALAMFRLGNAAMCRSTALRSWPRTRAIRAPSPRRRSWSRSSSWSPRRSSPTGWSSALDTGA